jgi:outer membrane lipopolysaccharide assembly protein LptE/RlpB
MARILRTPNSGLRTCSRLILVIWIALLPSCGYQLVGKETHVPPGLTSVAIPTFINQTFEPGIEIPLTQGFLREFIQDKRIKVLDQGDADSTLEGVIKHFYMASASYDRSGFVLEYQTTVIIDLILRKNTGEVIWKESDLSETRWYRASSNVLFNEASKTSAIQQIGTLMAERVRNRFFYDF